MAGIIGMPTMHEYPSALKQQVMSDERDPFRPRPSLMQQDINLVSDEELEELKRLFPGYEPLETEPEIEETEKDKPEDTKPLLPESPKPKADSSIKTFQNFFSTSLPMIGSVYTGPVDGIYSDELGAAAVAVESAVSKATGASAAGMIFNNTTKTFNTSPGDIISALKLISEHQKTEKLASIRQRINYFQKIIAK